MGALAPLLCAVLASAGGEPDARAPERQSAWREVAGPAESEPVLRVRELGGSVLEARGDRVVRVRGEAELALGCTAPRGTGAVRELAADPAGTTFVAAENGLFVTSPEVLVLDPVELGDGAPRGAPTSVRVDARRRVWLATEDAFGVVEPSFHWGRTLAVGAPDAAAPGPYRILGAREGEILVETARGVLAYRPDAGPEPTVGRVELGGRTVARGEEIRAAYGRPIEIEAAGTALGGARFRYRLDRHHVWRRLLEDGVEQVVEPGEHLLEIAAVDRDLNVSEPFPLALRVAYPVHYEKKFVLAFAGAVTAAIGGAFLLGARRRGGGRVRTARAALSTLLVVVLGGQVLAGLVPHARGWPFMGYSMYTSSSDVGDVAYRPVLVVISADGTPRDARLRELGDFDDPWQVLRPLIDGGDEAHAAALRRLSPKGARPERFARLQVRAERTLVTAEGPVRIAPLILSDHRRGDGR